MDYVEIFQNPGTHHRKSRVTLVEFICDCGCGEVCKKRPCDVRKRKLHFKDKKHMGYWLGKNHKPGKRKKKDA
ncbi:MAG: hypothetical protein PHN57_07850 [Candidatus Omnitrophica bacterium]|nr:hypothetical protein [Candidatus Omnitrophota bacterium]